MKRGPAFSVSAVSIILILLILSTSFVSASVFSDFSEWFSDLFSRITGQQISSGAWTLWYDRDDPSGSGDWEDLAGLKATYPGQICEKPSKVECQTTSGINYNQTGQNVTCTTTDGFVCVNANNPGSYCLDYKVRFYCETTQTPSATPPSDTTAPSISGVSVTPTHDSTLISWATNENSNSCVEYWTGSNAHTTTCNQSQASVTSHSVNITGLSPSTSYTYTAKSTDAAGNTGTSTSGFTTPSLSGSRPPTCVSCSAPPSGCNYVNSSCTSCGTLVCEKEGPELEISPKINISIFLTKEDFYVGEKITLK